MHLLEMCIQEAGEDAYQCCGLRLNHLRLSLIYHAYWSLKEESWNPKDPFWKRSWKYQEPEDTLHVLRDCSAAKEIWKHIIPDNQLFSYRHTFHTSDSDITLGEMWVHLFIDGVVVNDNGHVSTGGVIRYHHGNWILGFTRYLGRCSVFEAELWGI
ncbi:hypothetical protein Gohar_005538 [Gossypium harknessii]|uniref:RNase H type-1 domain-containing protein n=1 Tax=Gossypium harknessii TaxID=34285 RepID=A0A7J9H8A0_9ROSI|nr:hypothetical protein [Gossypium harknessii]